MCEVPENSEFHKKKKDSVNEDPRDNKLVQELLECSNNTKPNQINYIYGILNLFRSFPPKEKLDQIIEKSKISLPESQFDITICLDLDETLVYSDFSRNFDTHDYVHKGKVNAQYGAVGINFRPGFDTFLEYLSKNFQVVLFTSSIKAYADKVLKLIDPQSSIFSFRLYRENCVDTTSQFSTKDLRIIKNRSLDKVFLIDNNLINLCYQLNNGYLITSFYNDKSDNELPKLQRFLEENKHNLKKAFKERCQYISRKKSL